MTDMTAEEWERRHAARLEDLRWMAETGECMAGAAKRLGVSESAVDNFLRRHCDDPELAALLMRRNPGSPTSNRGDVRPRKRTAKRIAAEDALFTPDEMRGLHAAYQRGVRSERVLAGERAYQRQKRRNLRRVAA